MIQPSSGKPYDLRREHSWGGGWSVRDKDGGLVALVFDKNTALAVATALNEFQGDGVPVYVNRDTFGGVPADGETDLTKSC